MKKFALPTGATFVLSGPEDNPDSTNGNGKQKTPLVVTGALLSTVSAAVSAYHGYKRNNSVGWAVVWFLLGGLFPIITPVIAFAQGFGKPAQK